MPASGADGGALPMCSTDSPGPLGDVREGLARVTTIDETDGGVRVTLTNEATFSAIFANRPALATDDEVTVTAAGRGVWLERAGERVGYSIHDDSWFEPGSGIEVPGENLVLELVPTCSGTRAAPMGWSCDTLIDTGYAVRGTNGPIGEGSNGAVTGDDGRQWLVHVDRLRDGDFQPLPDGTVCTADLPSSFRLTVMPAS